MRIKLILLTMLVSLSWSMQSAPIGINVAEPRSLINSEAFVDLFKIAEGWFTSCNYWDRSRPIDRNCTRQNTFNTKEQSLLELDDNGWVRSFGNQARTFTYITKSFRFPANFKTGRFVVDYHGQGDIELFGQIKLVNEGTGFKVFDLLSTHGSFQIRIHSTNRQNYIRNIRVYRMENRGLINSQVFTPQYIKKLSGFDYIRFMTWSSIRTNDTQNWNDINWPQVSSYIGDKGVPEALMIELANQTKTNPWLSIPFKASDDYVRKMAHFTKSRLHSNAKIYLEYSNEMWNVIFPGTNWAKYQAQNRFRHWEQDFKNRNITNEFYQNIYLAINFYSLRTTEICKIWKKVFAGESHRVQCVLASYVDGLNLAKETLDCPLARRNLNGQTCASQVEAYAVGPYFGHYMAKLNNRAEFKSWARSPQWGKEQLFKELFNGKVLMSKNVQGQNLDKNGNVTTNPRLFTPVAPRGAIAKTLEEIRKSVDLARSFGLRTISYEGGQSIIRYDRPHNLSHNDKEIVEFITSVNKDPRMEHAYRRYLQGWSHLTGQQPFFHFSGLINSGPHPFFGIFDSMEQQTSPKWRAMKWYQSL